MTRRRNPYANRRVLSSRASRRAAVLSPRQETRLIHRLRATANRLIQKGLAEKLARPDMLPTN